MSIVRKTLEAFPRGLTTERLMVLLDRDFDPHKREGVLAELETLRADRVIRQDSRGRWVVVANTWTRPGAAMPRIGSGPEQERLVAAPARFASIEQDAPVQEQDSGEDRPDPQALLRYWRSALRADPRGATTQTADRHGVSWQLISGTGPVAPGPQTVRRVTLALDDLSPEFRKALLRREAEDQSLALGWPIAVGRKSGMPVIWPVGLLAGRWRRSETALEIEIDADDILVNPEWIAGASRQAGWARRELSDVFDTGDAIGMESRDFVLRLREAMAGFAAGRIDGVGLVAEIDPDAVALHDAAALFLPDESSFTAGAVRDLDAIAAWPEEQLSATALAAPLAIDRGGEVEPVPALNVGPLNGEQLEAVSSACTEPLTVITGPPGTGKSQAIVSIAASVIAAGGSVLVASRNHQALDAVEDRLGALAPEIPFLVRTLDPRKEIDRSAKDVLSELIADARPARSEADPEALADLRRQAAERDRLLAVARRSEEIAFELADLAERIALRDRRSPEADPAPPPRRPLWQRLRDLFRRTDADPGRENPATGAGASRAVLAARRDTLRKEREALPDVSTLPERTEAIAAAASRLLPSILAARTAPGGEKREALDLAKSDHDFAPGNTPLPGPLLAEIVRHRPLWLASVLGTPRRIPLEPALFDLVIFDEASQCDVASALPLLARARRAVVVGDDRQLSFIPQIGRAQDINLMRAQGLPVARMSRYAQSSQSLFDFARRVPGARRILLRRQYRSAAPIVDYISETFYGGALVVSHAPEGLNPPEGQKPGIAWQDVPAQGGRRSENVNEAEVAAIAAHLERLLVKDGYTGSVGVVTPFRAQVLALERALHGVLPAPVRAASELLVGTVDSFQGQERDVILFSPTVHEGAPQSGLTFFQSDTRRLNVGISRARAVAHVFGDLRFARSGKLKSLARLAAIATEPRRRTAEGVFDSDWERRVYNALRERGLEPHPQYEIAGRRLDFALFGKGGVKLDLEVDGRAWHQDADGRRKPADIWRDHEIRGLGWTVLRFWVDELSNSMEECIDRVERALS